jgi:hypothetical protein
MFDVDYAPGVFAGIIFWVFVLPALYGIFVVDKYRFWEKKGEKKEDAFN